MHGLTIRCQVLEVPDLDDTTPRDEGTWPRDLLPWADPYIARLLCKHRLEAALEDSVRYVKSVAADRANLPPARFDQAFNPIPPVLRPQTVNGWED